MPSAVRSLAFNATCLYILVYLLTIVLHEGGHATMALALGDHPVLYNTSVRNTSATLTDLDHVLIAAAGPVLSLLQGLLLLALLRQHRPAGPWGLLALYMGAFGLINFLGYIMIAPVVAGGDTGQIAALLHVPVGVRWLAAALALVVLILAIGRTGPLFLGVLPAGGQADPAARTSGLRALILWPWLLGSVALVLLALPAPHPAVVANMFMSPLVLRRAYAVAQRSPVQPGGGPGLLRMQWLPGAVLALAALIFKFLSRGVAL